MNEHLLELWQMMYAELKNYINIPDGGIKMWFGSVELKYISVDNKVYFAIDNFLKKKFIEEHYIPGFKKAMEAVLGFEGTPIFICTERDCFENQFAELVVMESDELKSSSDIKSEETENQDDIKDDIEKIYISFKKEELEETGHTPSAPRTLDNAIHRGIGARKKYNYQTGKFEEEILSDFLDNTDDGVLMMSRSTPPCYPSYTFDNFVVGSSNKFAYQYALQAARYPAQQYNPLYIYGAPGLGKTHLLYAITNEIMRLNPAFNIIYVKGEDFTNELVEAIQKRTPLQFREKYRNADVLLMDDIQFIAGRESSQEEFFHTYNALYEAGKQIIMTSDKPPKDVAKLEERLKSRFESGPIVKIDAPDIELRTAIIKKKFELMKIDIPNEVVMFLSENIKDNVRQIEGVIKKMNAYCLMCNEKITLELAEKSISDIVSLTSKIDSRKIINSTSEKFGVPIDSILGKKQVKEIAWARHMAIYAMRKLTDMSFGDIAKVFNRDRTTIMASVEKVERESEQNPFVAKDIQELFDIIKLKT